MRLDELLGSVVAPVLGALVPDFQITEIGVRASAGDEEVRLHVVAEGETFGFWVVSPGQEPESPDQLRHRLADQLQDWVPETRSAWGQLRSHRF
jgi:hypothetical protein